MIEQYIRGRIGVFIDDSNLFHSQKAMGWRVDYRRLLEYLKSSSTAGTIVRIYTPIKTGDIGRENFSQKLSRLGYSVVKKEVKVIRGEEGDLFKGNLDVELALDAYRHSDEYDNTILFSGDSDFAYLLDLLREKGKTAIVVSLRKHVSRELIERSKFVNLNKPRGYVEWINQPLLPAAQKLQRAPIAGSPRCTTFRILAKTKIRVKYFFASNFHVGRRVECRVALR